MYYHDNVLFLVHYSNYSASSFFGQINVKYRLAYNMFIYRVMFASVHFIMGLQEMQENLYITVLFGLLSMRIIILI